MSIEKLASLLRTKDWESVPERSEDPWFRKELVYEFCDITEREMIEFVGDDYVTVNAEGDVLYKWLEDEEFVYAPNNVILYGRKEAGEGTLRRFKKEMVTAILSIYCVDGEEE